MRTFGFQPCILCSLERQLIGAEPAVKNYEIQSLQCPECKSIVRLVHKRFSPRQRVKASESASLSAVAEGALISRRERTSWRQHRGRNAKIR
jgi:hypothetical protein